MRSSEPISKDTNLSSEVLDYEDTKISFSKLHWTFTEPIFKWEIFGLLSHTVREIFANYCLIN